MINDNWKAEDYAFHARFVSDLSQEVIRDLSPQQGETILDLGCGDGVLSREIMRQGCNVIGVDSSPDFVSAAHSIGVDARLCDAQSIEFDGEFDAVFSNAALHWMKRQREVSFRVHRALKPGGRFVAEMGGQGNIATLSEAMHTALDEIGIDFSQRNPWTFPDPGSHAKLLSEVGFEVRKCKLRDRTTPLPTDIHGWLATFTRKLLSDLDAAAREAVTNRIAELCRPKLCGPDETWKVDYVRLNFVAIKSD